MASNTDNLSAEGGSQEATSFLALNGLGESLLKLAIVASCT